MEELSKTEGDGGTNHKSEERAPVGMCLSN